MKTSLSLRARLTAVILTPLVAVAIIAGIWSYQDAQRNAAERFDRSLLSTALAISRDIAVTRGDALSQDTRDLLRDTSGGAVFYHVYAPDGVFVTGYATPPVPPTISNDDTPQYYDSEHLAEDVRALRITQQASVDGLSGPFTFTVWQSTDVRNGFVRARTNPVFATIAAMIGALVIIVWFGVRRGLAPLLDLEEAIARRSVDDLSPIKRRIPHEVTGIVDRFNNLLAELSSSIQAKDAFISDAAHQLRNPIAGVIALSESVHNAAGLEAAKERAGDLRDAAHDLGKLTNSLLTLERLKAKPAKGQNITFDAAEVLQLAARTFGPAAERNGIKFETVTLDGPCLIEGDPVMIEQAVQNLLNNAVVHGGADLSVVRLCAAQADDKLRIIVEDNGKAIAPEDFERALGRFSQIGPSAGSGLGLPIAAAVMEVHRGTISLEKADGLFRVTLELPLSDRQPDVKSA